MRNKSLKLFLIWASGSDVFKSFLNWSSGTPPVRCSGTIYKLFEDGIMGNIHVKLNEIWTSGSGGDVV